jgi:NitT/TauT family transport system substrate-binding protein
MLIRRCDDRHLVDDFETETGDHEGIDLLRIVRQQPDLFQAEIFKDLETNAVIAQIGPVTERGIGFDGVQAFVLQGNAALSLALVKGRVDSYGGPRDLKGRRIGVTAPGSSTHMVVNHLLASAQLKPEDVAIVGVGTGASAVGAVRSGQIDALSSVEPAVVMLERSGDARVVHETWSEAGTRAVFGGALPSASLYAKPAFLQANPATAQALANAMVRALRWLQRATTDQVLAVVPPEYTLGDRAAYVAALERLRGVYSRDGRIPPDGAALAWRVTATHDPSVRAAGAPTPEATFTNAFVDRVRAR